MLIDFPKNDNIFTITITGLVLIFFARAAYLNVLIVSLELDLAGDTQAICSIKKNTHTKLIQLDINMF